GIQNIGGTVYVAYAWQGEGAVDDVDGIGHGYIDAFDTAGHLLRRVASKGPLNSPWGLALSPGDFGLFSEALLVGNFGDGKIHAYDLSTSGEAKLLGQLHSENGSAQDRWACGLSNSAKAAPRGSGPSNTLLHGG